MFDIRAKSTDVARSVGFGTELVFERRDHGDAIGVATSVERRGEEELHDLVGQTQTDDPGAHREHVGVVVGAGHARGVEVVAERRSDPTDLVRSQLLALPAATEHDAEVGITVTNRPADRGAERRIVGSLGRVSAEIGHLVARGGEQFDHVSLEVETGVVGSDGDTEHPPSIRGGSRGRPLVWSADAADSYPRQMALDPRTPVLIGVGQISHHAASIEDALGPIELMAEAVRRAATDAGLGSIPDPDSVRVVDLLSIRAADPGRLVAEALGVTSPDTALTTSGGNSPQALVNLTAGEIQRGELELAVLAGAEAWRTRSRARKLGVGLPWPREDAGAAPARRVGPPFEMSLPAEVERGIYLPVQIYPIFETALRAARGESLDDHLVRISELWAGFSAVAADNAFAWSRDAKSAEEIRTPTARNRMIGLPYTKSFNSNNDVDQGAALIICSVAKAQALGVPRDRWVFVHAGADCHEHTFVSHRWSFTETPAIRRGGEVALGLAGVGIDDVAIVDLYSCFPSAVQLGAASLGLPLESQLTRTGGLNFAGGPWNNYVMHAIATVVGELRERSGERGLVWANGGYATKHSFGVYSTEPPAAGFRHGSPQAEIDALPRRELAPPADAAGTATVEGYTVMHDRDGAPEQVIASCLLADGRRAWGLGTDRSTAADWCVGEWVGREIDLDASGTLR